MVPEQNGILSAEATIQTHEKSGAKLFPIIASASIGTLIEFYDLILAVVLAPVLAQHLFPPGEARFLETLAIVVTSYLIRPIGALIFGGVGDAKGPQKTIPGFAVVDGKCNFSDRLYTVIRNNRLVCSLVTFTPTSIARVSD